MKKIELLSILLVISLLISGCSGTKEAKTDEPQRERTYIERYEDAVEAFEAKKYYKSLEDFSFVVFNAPGSDIADDAQFYLASSHFEMKEYLVAIDEYQQLLRRWPKSDLYEETRFKIAECYYKQSPGYQRDQQYILKAIRSYQDFIDEYPYSEQRPDAEKRIKELRTGLANKVFEAGELYMILREWNAAIITFQEILDNYYDTNLVNDTYLEIAACHAKLEQREKLILMLDRVEAEKLSTTQTLQYNSLMELSTDWQK
ncbi:MAG: outer membrane protein assembly factor BamD [Candidatus Marinimicrobia bacterium]|nr:outer membrane protein assembly factor BamD [Candidatus Neomarinimicrobiota bacterium]